MSADRAANVRTIPLLLGWRVTIRALSILSGLLSCGTLAWVWFGGLPRFFLGAELQTPIVFTYLVRLARRQEFDGWDELLVDGSLALFAPLVWLARHWLL